MFWCTQRVPHRSRAESLAQLYKISRGVLFRRVRVKHREPYWHYYVACTDMLVACTDVQMLTNRACMLKQQREMDAQAEQRMGESLGRSGGPTQHRALLHSTPMVYYTGDSLGARGWNEQRGQGKALLPLKGCIIIPCQQDNEGSQSQARRSGSHQTM